MDNVNRPHRAMSLIKQLSVDASLEMGHTPASRGICEEHEILKQTGKVSRHRQYRVYLPEGYDPARSYPLVMVLHGCRQDHQAIQAITGFDAIADRVGAIVVYPFITSYAGVRSRNCWGWWLSRQRQRGRGEVSDLHRIAEQVAQRYSVDPSRRHVCGLSAGGAMAVACLAAYSDFWASGASVAGVPYGESSRAVKVNEHVPVRRKSVNTLVRMLNRELVAKAPPLLVVQLQADKMVGPKLGVNMRDSWIAASGCDPQVAAVYSDTTRGYRWRLEQYGDQDAVRVGHLLIDELDHGWPGGLPGKFCYPDAPNVSELIWTFFDVCS